MKYEDFLLECAVLAPNQLKEVGLYKDERRYSWARYDEWKSVYDGNRKQMKEIKYILYVEWETGGVSGGSCWDHSDPQPYTSNKSPEELTELDNILEKFKPDLSFIQYRKLTNELITVGDRCVNEYYGNYTNYANKQIDMEKLYNYMNERGWLK